MKRNQEIQRLAVILVRESGYNAAVIQATGQLDETYSRAMYIYQTACDLLRSLKWIPDTHVNAEAFINCTYKPEMGK